MAKMIDAIVINKIQRQVKHRGKNSALLAEGRLISLRFKKHLQITKKKNLSQMRMDKNPKIF